MIKKIKFFSMVSIFVCICTGCATISVATSENRENLLKLNIGMPKQEVLSIMRTTPITAYYKPGTYGKTVSVIINNPYRSEIFKGKTDKTVEVLYYVVEDKDGDGKISDKETTPLIFEENKLTGWGWSCLEYTIKKYEITVKNI